MKSTRLLMLVALLAFQFSSCMSTKDMPGHEPEQVPTGNMGGGTGSGTIGDDPTNP